MKRGSTRIIAYINFWYPHQQYGSEGPVLSTYYCFSGYSNDYRGIWNWKISTQCYGKFTIVQLIAVDRAERNFNTEGYYCSQTSFHGQTAQSPCLAFIFLLFESCRIVTLFILTTLSRGACDYSHC